VSKKQKKIKNKGDVDGVLNNNNNNKVNNYIAIKSNKGYKNNKEHKTLKLLGFIIDENGYVGVGHNKNKCLGVA
jgi:hypothetical protein